MPQKLSTRPATLADLPFLMRLRKLTMHEHQARAGERTDDDWHRQRIMVYFDSANIVCLDQTPIGLFKHYRTQEEWVLVQIQVLPEHQGKGIGEQLIRGLLDQARQAGVPVALSVLRGNPARRLYERLGFEEVAREGNEFKLVFHEKSDIWADWLLHYRHGGDAKVEQRIRREVAEYADRVLDGARLGAGMTLADIGTGDGVVALRAVERLGSSLKVLMTDISAPLLDHARTLAAERGVLGQCTFMQGSADSLAGVAQDCVDAVTARAVLAYVADKPAAFREFHRVLRPGGYMSIAEPIMQDDAIEVCALKKLIDSNPATRADPFFPMLLRWRSMLYPDTEEKMRRLPITNFGERDLVRHALDAGFTDVHMELHVDVRGADRRPPWDVYLELSPHPLAPTLNEVLHEHFTPEERIFFEARLRAVYEESTRFGVERIAWLTARKPAAAG